MVSHKVLILSTGKLSALGQHIQAFFQAELETEIAGVKKQLLADNFKVVVIDQLASVACDLDQLQAVIELDEQFTLPVVVLAKALSIQDKLGALELGCDDFVEPSVTGDEACARITKAILHQVAADQLSSRLELANQTAYSAMLDNSDLGANIQFLLSVHDCDNLDQLGQLFFTTIERYGLKCSLQLRSENEIKNMEAHGMAKDLESQLLYQLKDRGRYTDFGSRTIINYDRVSLLIKNMPLADNEKYGAIKDNTFSLVQGMNARVIALEHRYRLIDERETLKRLGRDVRKVMEGIQDSYQKVMRGIANEVDSTADKMRMKLPSLALMEHDELFIENLMDDVIRNTTGIFNEGLLVDEVIEKLEGKIERSLAAIEEHVEVSHQHQADDHGNAGEAPVELF
ncbi:response regulator receiver protein [Agaribacterium haliotis]|uniref:response regulator receiver protein n=1 Tax=Agaribacterium haliotis TaxID=2013869 RepID=UPI000BB58EE6|nr:response regulator receiver protein [Agaribacterium haliotis]